MNGEFNGGANAHTGFEGINSILLAAAISAAKEFDPEVTTDEQALNWIVCYRDVVRNSGKKDATLTETVVYLAGERAGAMAQMETAPSAQAFTDFASDPEN